MHVLAQKEAREAKVAAARSYLARVKSEAARHAAERQSVGDRLRRVDVSLRAVVGVRHESLCLLDRFQAAAFPQCAEPQNAFLSACVFFFIAQHSIVLQAVCVS